MHVLARERVRGHELVSVSETSNNCLSITSLLKSPEPTSLVVQQVEDGTAHQPVSIVQHHSKTQANSLSTPSGLFLVLSTEPGGDKATVKGAGGNKNRPHVGHIKMVDMDPEGYQSTRNHHTHPNMLCRRCRGCLLSNSMAFSASVPCWSRNIRRSNTMNLASRQGNSQAASNRSKMGLLSTENYLIHWHFMREKVMPSLHDINDVIAYSPFVVAAVKFWPQLTSCL